MDIIRTNLVIFTTLMFASFTTIAATCPPIDKIKRMDGTYQWVTDGIPGWSGYFSSPKIGKGNSYNIKKFLSARWIKHNNSRNSKGSIECYYIGDFGYTESKVSTDNKDSSNIEVIILKQHGSISSEQPFSSNSWLCHAITKFPNPACTCSSGLKKCDFSIG